MPMDRPVVLTERGEPGHAVAHDTPILALDLCVSSAVWAFVPVSGLMDIGSYVRISDTRASHRTPPDAEPHQLREI